MVVTELLDSARSGTLWAYQNHASLVIIVDMYFSASQMRWLTQHGCQLFKEAFKKTKKFGIFQTFRNPLPPPSLEFGNFPKFCIFFEHLERLQQCQNDLSTFQTLKILSLWSFSSSLPYPLEPFLALFEKKIKIFFFAEC